MLISRNRSSRGSSCSRLLGPWTFGGSEFVAEHERRKKEQTEQRKPQGGKLPPYVHLEELLALEWRFTKELEVFVESFESETCKALSVEKLPAN